MMNGRLQGSFKGEKGLRQGDPISPLIFVLVMDYLTRILIYHAGKVGFGFHPLCKQLKLVNLCFVDDLMIFCKGNENSVRFIHEAFTLFCDTTYLKANMNKSAIYFGGVNEVTKRAILNLMNMEEGSFPLRYLGVKLRLTNWKTSDCGCILDKVNLKLNNWASKFLSFAGRAQLIHSVLLGIRKFWMNLFILPKKVTAAIDKSYRDFLWGVNGNRSKFHLPS
uniref:Reverse transcriptase domain-containing protein n=1 Tax=Cannabis sativa TaxID=3483 RepID=A0A803PV51_CANSA